MTFALGEIAVKLDRLTHRYNVGHVKVNWQPGAVVELHAGTSLPKRVSGMGELAAETVVFRQEWHCCGEYSCSSGTGKDSATKRCSATGVLRVLSTGVVDDFVVDFIEPPIEDHGIGYVAPSVDAPPRYAHQLRVRLHELSETAIDFDDLVEQLEPHLRPVGAKAVKEYKRRFQNIVTSRKRPASLLAMPPAATKSPAKKIRSKAIQQRRPKVTPNVTPIPFDADAAAMLVGLSQPAVGDHTDIELTALPGIDDLLAAL